MVEHCYSKSSYDNCVYHKQLSDSLFVYLLLYVDDMLIVTPCLEIRLKDALVLAKYVWVSPKSQIGRK